VGLLIRCNHVDMVGNFHRRLCRGSARRKRIIWRTLSRQLYVRITSSRQRGISISHRRVDSPFGKTYSSLIGAALAVMTAQCSRFGPTQHRLPGCPSDPFALFVVFKESSCQSFCITGYISAATRMRNTRLCRGLAGTSIAVPSTSPQYACSSHKSGFIRRLVTSCESPVAQVVAI
jgi:hypothetical protein